jgi:hypothetical protein
MTGEFSQAVSYRRSERAYLDSLERDQAISDKRNLAQSMNDLEVCRTGLMTISDWLLSGFLELSRISFKFGDHLGKSCGWSFLIDG